MGILKQLEVRSSVLKGHINKYAILGLGIAILSILIGSMLASYQQTGFINFSGFILAQRTNPALWALDLCPLIFAYWGQAFFYELASTMEDLVEDKTRELMNKSSDLALKLEYETHHDYLTHLPNQRLLSQRIKQGIQSIHKGEKLVVILLHINGFKDVNYQYGNFNANNLLIQFSERLKSVLLEPYLLQAYMGMNMIARLQGAEFAILIPRLREEHRWDDLLPKLIESNSAKFMIDGNSIQVTVTAGIAIYPLHGNDDMSLIQHASSSLFYAEKEGMPYAIYDSVLHQNTNVHEENFIKTLHTAVDNDMLHVWYQPELELKKDKIIGVEAIPYFDEQQPDMPTPEKLLQLVEGSDVVIKLTRQMLKQAVRQLAAWRKAGYEMYTTVNLLDATDHELPEFIQALLVEHEVTAEYLKVALTEKVCLSDQTHSMIVLKQLAQIGVKIRISDFGSGYASFTYLTNFPITEIKIDKSFIMSMMSDEKKLSIVHAVIKMAEALNLTVFADGIVDQRSMKKLVQLGCLYGQGPYYSPAVEADAISALLVKPKE